MIASGLHGRIWAQLEKVPEPCSIAMGGRKTICDMGLIEAVEVLDGRAIVTLCLTDPGCINYRAIQSYIEDVLLELEDIRSVEVLHTTDVVWTPDRERTLRP
jgi:metal-sulfur cluster biosynthetic enzyme